MRTGDPGGIGGRRAGGQVTRRGPVERLRGQVDVTGPRGGPGLDANLPERAGVPERREHAVEVDECTHVDDPLTPVGESEPQVPALERLDRDDGPDALRHAPTVAGAADRPPAETSATRLSGRPPLRPARATAGSAARRAARRPARRPRRGPARGTTSSSRAAWASAGGTPTSRTGCRSRTTSRDRSR